VRKIENGRADFPDGHFDLVFSNQVLEHVTDPEAVIGDMYRLVKPGGTLITAFPVTETWYEGHIGLYFAHRFPKGSALRQRYFDLSHRMGLGIHRGKHSREAWVEKSGRTLDDVCFYYRRARMKQAVENTFGAPIEDIAVDYMRTRLGARAERFPAVADPLLRFVYHKRAGEIWRTRKAP
jgi:SAM-dependent methyltransferase